MRHLSIYRKDQAEHLPSAGSLYSFGRAAAQFPLCCLLMSGDARFVSGAIFQPSTEDTGLTINQRRMRHVGRPKGFGSKGDLCCGFTNATRRLLGMRPLKGATAAQGNANANQYFTTAREVG